MTGRLRRRLRRRLGLREDRGARPSARLARTPPGLKPTYTTYEGEDIPCHRTMRQLLDEAAKGGDGVGTFNVNSLGQVRAIIMEDAGVYPEMLSVREIREGIGHEVRNANVDTALRLAATGTIRKPFAEDPGEFDPRYYLVSARSAMRRVLRARMEAFRQEAGHAEDHAPVSPADTAVRHKERDHQPSAA